MYLGYCRIAFKYCCDKIQNQETWERMSYHNIQMFPVYIERDKNPITKPEPIKLGTIVKDYLRKLVSELIDRAVYVFSMLNLLGQ